MRRFVALSILAALVALAIPAMAQSAEPVPSPSAPAVTLSAEQFAALVAKTTAGTAEPAKASVVSASGILGMSWETIAGLVGGLAFAIFGLFKGAGAIRARQMVVAAAEGAWHIAERAGVIYELEGATKGALALEAFIEAMGGSVKADQVATARQLWKAQSAKAGPAQPTAKEVGQAEADASVAKQAAGGASATDLLKQAGS